MKKVKSILAILLIMLNVSCNKKDDVLEKEEVIDVAINYAFNSYDKEDNVMFASKCLENSSEVKYKDEEGKNANFFTSKYAINYDSLIGGDAYRFVCFGDGNMFVVQTFPSTLYINYSKIEVEVLYATIYEIMLIKDENSYSLEFISQIQVQGPSIEIYPGNVIYTIKDQIRLKSIDEYEDGTIFYYAYNEALNENQRSNYSYLYDYDPRKKCAE